MKKLLLVPALSVAACFASPANAAGEGRMEIRTGVAWTECCSDESIGIAVGYDYDLSESMFIGAEAVADTNFDFVSPVVGVNARVGLKTSDNGKLFAVAGYAYDTDWEIDDAVLGLGYQHNIGKVLVSAQYKRYLDLDINRGVVGIGIRF